MLSNKEIENKLNLIIANQKAILELLQAQQKDTDVEETPFKTKEGLYNYKHRKPIPKDD